MHLNLKGKNSSKGERSIGLCDSKKDESVEHLFLKCPFSLECLQILLLHNPQFLTPFEVLDELKRQIQKPFFIEIIILMAWSIWQTCKDTFADTNKLNWL